MVDNLKPDDRRRTMQEVKSKRTSLERQMRAMLAGMGIRDWRTNAIDVPGKPDIVFAERRAAIFVDGCFWHSCPVCARPLPVTNRGYWEHKLARNVARSERIDLELQTAAWVVLHVWDHDFRGRDGKASIRRKIRQALGISGEVTE